jgi:hypothetical protein
MLHREGSPDESDGLKSECRLQDRAERALACMWMSRIIRVRRVWFAVHSAECVDDRSCG